MSRWREPVVAAVDALRAGQVVGVPTDTVYGVAVDPARPGATDALFAVKERPRSVSLPVLVAGLDQAVAVAADGALAPTTAARRLADALWPGGLTLVVARRPGLGWDLGGDDDRTVGLRCPDQAIIHRLCAAVGPLATTSANRHGQPPLTTAAAVAAAFGDHLAVVVDGGTCDGVPSTVVDCTGPTLRCLRQGTVPWETVQQLGAAS